MIQPNQRRLRKRIQAWFRARLAHASLLLGQFPSVFFAPWRVCKTDHEKDHEVASGPHGKASFDIGRSGLHVGMHKGAGMDMFYLPLQNVCTPFTLPHAWPLSRSSHRGPLPFNFWVGLVSGEAIGRLQGEKRWGCDYSRFPPWGHCGCCSRLGEGHSSCHIPFFCPFFLPPPLPFLTYGFCQVSALFPDLSHCTPPSSPSLALGCCTLHRSWGFLPGAVSLVNGLFFKLPSYPTGVCIPWLTAWP